MFKRKSTFLLLSIITLFAFVNTLNATDGYFRHGYGVKYSALAGAGIAIPLSSLGAISNPAGLVHVGNRYDFNVSVFSPMREYTVTGNPSGFPGTFPLAPGTIESESNIFFFPTFGASWMLNDNMALGIAAYGNGGMNTDYPTNTFGDQSSPSTGVSLEQMFVAATYSIEISKNHALGVSAILGWQRFAAKGLAMFGAMGMSSSPENLSGNSFGIATGFGGKIGYQGQFGEMFRFGAMYQSKIFMSEFDRYKGLFAEKGKFDVPATWSAGIAFIPDENWTIMLDFQQIQYSGVKAVSNPIDPMALPPMFPDGMGGFVPNPNYVPLGSDNGSGFGWKDMNIVKLGLMKKCADGFTLMAGYSYGKQPIPESEVLFNILAPAVVEHHITIGATKAFNKNHEVTIAVMYAPSVTVSGANRFEAPGAQIIDIKMSQLQVDLGYAFNIY